MASRKTRSLQILVPQVASVCTPSQRRRFRRGDLGYPVVIVLEIQTPNARSRCTPGDPSPSKPERGSTPDSTAESVSANAGRGTDSLERRSCHRDLTFRWHRGDRGRAQRRGACTRRLRDPGAVGVVAACGRAVRCQWQQCSWKRKGRAARLRRGCGGTGWEWEQAVWG